MTAPTGRRQRDPAGRRKTIIDAATRVIADAGLAGLTHRRVAEVAGVPVGSTTYYFRDLDELREAALADAAAGFEGRVGKPTGPVSGLSLALDIVLETIHQQFYRPSGPTLGLAPAPAQPFPPFVNRPGDRLPQPCK